MDAYDATLTRSTPMALSIARMNMGAATVGNYALAMGGSKGTNDGEFLSTVDAYDTALTRTMPMELSRVRELLAGTSLEDYALAMGGNIQRNRQLSSRL